MKKLIVLFILVPFLSFAKYYEGSLYFSDGKIVTGLLEFEKDHINYKSSQKDVKQQFKNNDLDKMIVKISNDETLTYIATKIFYLSSSSKTEVPTDDKMWLELLYDGKIKIYVYSFSMSSISSSGYNLSSNYANYYLKIPSKELPNLVFYDFGSFNTIKKLIGEYLKDDCPKLIDLLDKKDIKKNGFAKIGVIYDQNCGK